jgi:hypothetical protein
LVPTEATDRASPIFDVVITLRDVVLRGYGLKPVHCFAYARFETLKLGCVSDLVTHPQNKLESIRQRIELLIGDRQTAIDLLATSASI